MKKPTHIFFDLDNTLTRSRTPIAPEHVPLLKHLCEERDVVVVSGAEKEQIRKQITKELDGLYFILAQRGNHALRKDGSEVWRETLDENQRDAVFAFVDRIKKELDLQVKDENDLVEHRGSQIGYSLIGHHEDVAKKEAFDPGSVKRIKILEAHREDVDHLLQIGISVEPGGTTCLDFFLAGYHKGFNIGRFVEELVWEKDDCIYLGDELEEGRNDESVIGVIPTHAVKNPKETFEYVKML